MEMQTARQIKDISTSLQTILEGHAPLGEDEPFYNIVGSYHIRIVVRNGRIFELTDLNPGTVKPISLDDFAMDHIGKAVQVTTSPIVKDKRIIQVPSQDIGNFSDMVINAINEMEDSSAEIEDFKGFKQFIDDVIQFGIKDFGLVKMKVKALGGGRNGRAYYDPNTHTIHVPMTYKAVMKSYAHSGRNVKQEIADSIFHEEAHANQVEKGWMSTRQLEAIEGMSLQQAMGKAKIQTAALITWKGTRYLSVVRGSGKRREEWYLIDKADGYIVQQIGPAIAKGPIVSVVPSMANADDWAGYKSLPWEADANAQAKRLLKLYFG